ncbi:hypothetical protein [Pseudomonas sp. MWU12-2323]|uniref:hypothetical protein n=1 Tax=Pseudomonas sp. MWU12-2323 TaxID=2651296 RepID=UPI00128C6621|nr:hypothetical protein [Pseudomonas sp. MWU12-2323]MPQ69362.1 hypothetical protein [Pseudomonas sp. MWU12-2323]
MSQHKVELAANLPSGKAGVVLGYDRWPHEHFFCNVCASLGVDDTDEPLWASIFDQELDHVTNVDGFDVQLAEYGITLPKAMKSELRTDWARKEMHRDVIWKADGTILTEAK